MSAPLVSVIIAAYNAGEYLREAVGSVLSQSVADLELVVVDDGSSDGSTEFLRDVTDERLHVVRQSNSGQTVAKNRGIKESNGRIIGFCDADDYWYPNKLALQLPRFEDNPTVGVVYSSAQMIDADGSEISTYWPEPHNGNVMRQMLIDNFVPFGTALVRRGCIDDVGVFDERLRMGIDWDLWLRISTKYEFRNVLQPTYAYRVWDGQMSSDWEGRYRWAFEIMERFIRENGDKVDPWLRREAYANTYASRARARMETDRLGAVKDALRAIKTLPTYWFSWKTLARVLRGSA